ncbi:hypothetical protein VRB50_21120 [Pseudomonas poae]|uniref:Uncharacterized protein n=1 Tax=Pseudomonas poae TaxID=200451 RepID=A0AAP2S1M7_9PSED|nr:MULTISPECIES: hypothetical protein [Pseudomonas]MCF5655813.1 hypothetical protein [Pseudomonas poae]MCF5778202.1 hypothetical protein [Pseudomonas poae]NMZ52137.1 hypothetical protein [Pseudomonas poae]CRM18701.1 hypothetical protein [Pseudomonas sp. 25 E 4]
MVKSQRMLTKPDVYQGLIDRLGRALDAASTAGRLRDERPVELELRGLSRAELELIKAYLEKNERSTPRGVASPPPSAPTQSSNVVWLKDAARGRGPATHRAERFK